MSILSIAVVEEEETRREDSVTASCGVTVLGGVLSRSARAIDLVVGAKINQFRLAIREHFV